MPSDFTADERHAIRSAFDAVTSRIERTDWTLPREWREAFKYEKRECSGPDWARALMVEEFIKGARTPDPVAELIRIRSGARVAHMIGAAMAERAKRYGVEREFFDELGCLCDNAKLAKSVAFKRRADAIHPVEVK